MVGLQGKEVVMMKKHLCVLFSFVFCCIYAYAGTLDRAIATENIIVPQGFTKVVFAQNNYCSKNAIMTIENQAGERFDLESRGTGVPPFMYLIPDGDYVIVNMTNMKSCNTAVGTLTIGSKFSGKSVGYITFMAVEEPEVIDSFDKVVSSESNQTIPKGTSCVVFAFKPSVKMVVVDSNGKKWQFDGHIPPYFYFIKYGIYKVIKMEGMSQCNTAHGSLTVGDTFEVSENTSVGYFT